MKLPRKWFFPLGKRVCLLCLIGWLGGSCLASAQAVLSPERRMDLLENLRSILHLQDELWKTTLEESLNPFYFGRVPARGDPETEQVLIEEYLDSVLGVIRDHSPDFISMDGNNFLAAGSLGILSVGEELTVTVPEAGKAVTVEIIEITATTITLQKSGVVLEASFRRPVDGITHSQNRP